MKERILKLTKMQGFQTVLEFFSILHDLSISNRRFLMDNRYDSQAIVRTSKSRRIAKVCDFIEKNYGNQIKLSEVAEMVNMSESAFSHFFKKKTNCTFIDYVMVRGNWNVLSHAVLSDYMGEIFPSDHCPVIVKMEMK